MRARGGVFVVAIGSSCCGDTLEGVSAGFNVTLRLTTSSFGDYVLEKEKNMLKVILAAIFSIAFGFSNLAWSACYGTGTYKTCYDANGNSQTVSKIGNSTTVTGTNAQTGSSWSQTSTDYGNITITNGNSNGSSWNSTSTTIGNTTFTNGTATNGNSFNQTTTVTPIGTTTSGTNSNNEPFNNWNPN